jgi:hypothetical protein
MQKVLLISENTLKTYTPISESVQSDELRFSILQAQTIFLQESLGTNLFEQMLYLVENNLIDSPANVRYKDLLDVYIQPMLITYAYYLAIDNFYVKFVSVGMTQNRSEQGDKIDHKTFQYLKSNAKQQAEFNDSLLRRHLIFRSGLYPEYTSGNLNDGQLPPIPSTPFQSPITIPTTAFAWSGQWRTNGSLNGCSNAPFSLCAGSPFPTWYGRSTNSPGVR